MASGGISRNDPNATKKDVKRPEVQEKIKKRLRESNHL